MHAVLSVYVFVSMQPLKYTTVEYTKYHARIRVHLSTFDAIKHNDVSLLVILVHVLKT